MEGGINLKNISQKQIKIVKDQRIMSYKPIIEATGVQQDCSRYSPLWGWIWWWEIVEYAVNVIAQNIYAQVDEEGHHTLTVKEIFDHKTDGSQASRGTNTSVIVNGKTCPRHTIIGWKLWNRTNKTGILKTNT